MLAVYHADIFKVIQMTQTAFSELPDNRREFNSIASRTSLVDLTDPAAMTELSDLQSRRLNTSTSFLPEVDLFESDAPTGVQDTALAFYDTTPRRPPNSPGHDQHEPTHNHDGPVHEQPVDGPRIQTTTGTDGTTEETTTEVDGRVSLRTRTSPDGVLLESEVNNPDGSSETFSRLRDGSTQVRRVNGDNVNVTTTAPDGSTEESTYVRERLQSRFRRNADGSTVDERRMADGSTRTTRRGANGNLIEDRMTTTDARGLRTTAIVDGNGLRRRETELPGDTSELPTALHTSGPCAQHLRVDYFDPSDPTGQRVSRSSIYYTGNGIGPEGPTILRAERSFDERGRMRQSIDYIPITGYRVNGYDSNGHEISTRLNPLHAHDGYAGFRRPAAPIRIQR